MKLIFLIFSGIILLIIGIFLLKDSKEQESYKYPEVYIINYKYSKTLDSLGIKQPIRDDFWEETACSLGVSVDSLTIDEFITHLKQEGYGTRYYLQYQTY